MKGIKYLENSKRYEVPIPWKCEKVNLSTNYAMAMQRLKNTEQKLRKNTQLKDRYSEIIKIYEKRVH